MRKFLLILPISIALLLGTIVYAQDSPFGGLTGETASDRMILSVTGLTIQDYLTAKENYIRLVELYERSYGTRRAELAEQRVARAKDVLVGKLGAVLSYLSDLFDKTLSTGRLVESSMMSLGDLRNEFEGRIPAYEEQIENAESMSTLSTLSSQINEDMKVTMESARVYTSILAVARGGYLITRIEEKAPIIQVHINASGDLGGDVGGVQNTYDNSMLSLEDARDEYGVISGMIGDGTTGGYSADVLRSRVRSANGEMREAFDGLNSVLSELRTLYSNSPWEIDVSQFELGEESTEESTETEDMGEGGTESSE
jgi:hypothetical protein